VVITDLGILRPAPPHGEFELTAVYEGITVEQVREATGWELKVAEELVTPAPLTELELQTLRDLRAAVPVA